MPNFDAVYKQRIEKVLSFSEFCFIYLFILNLFVLDDSWISKGTFVGTKHLRVLIHIRNKDEVGTVKHV